MFGTSVKGGTGARSKPRPDKTLPRCECGGFIAPLRHQEGATRCVRCETESDRHT